MRFVINIFIFTSLLAVVLGCGANETYSDASVEYGGRSRYKVGVGRAGPGAIEDLDQSVAGESSPTIPSSIGVRKIIYTAETGMVVEDFSVVESKLKQLVQQHRGFIAQADLDTRNQQSRSGNWTVRVPVDEFDGFLTQVSTIGVVTSQSRNAQDVTEEYVDVESRIKNKQKLEARILKLLERPDDKIEHVIEVEKELGRVREAIETMQGRIRYLKDQTELTTVHLSIREEKAYQPPSATGFSNRLSDAWNGSLKNIKRSLENAAVWLAGNGLSLAFWVFVVVIAWKSLGRKFIKLLSESPTNTPSEDTQV